MGDPNIACMMQTVCDIRLRNYWNNEVSLLTDNLRLIWRTFFSIHMLGTVFACWNCTILHQRDTKKESSDPAQITIPLTRTYLCASGEAATRFKASLSAMFTVVGESVRLSTMQQRQGYANCVSSYTPSLQGLLYLLPFLWAASGMEGTPDKESVSSVAV